MANRIHVKGDYIQDELPANGSGIYPGMLIKVNSSGKAIAHNVEGGDAQRMFACEDALQGKTVNDAYATNDIVTAILPVPGAEVNALLKAGYVYSIGEEVMSGGDGTLIPYNEPSTSTISKETIAYCMDAVDLTVTDAVNTLSRVRIK